mmetsp:Transcript_112733/g.218467  ORF Transcript_112733/g.218467 Transcript_112733/m.218467 type:complete len:235 (+) Transcript_112733:586-1290(+)
MLEEAEVLNHRPCTRRIPFCGHVITFPHLGLPDLALGLDLLSYNPGPSMAQRCILECHHRRRRFLQSRFQARHQHLALACLPRKALSQGTALSRPSMRPHASHCHRSKKCGHSFAWNWSCLLARNVSCNSLHTLLAFLGMEGILQSMTCRAGPSSMLASFHSLARHATGGAALHGKIRKTSTSDWFFGALWIAMSSALVKLLPGPRVVELGLHSATAATTRLACCSRTFRAVSC